MKGFDLGRKFTIQDDLKDLYQAKSTLLEMHRRQICREFGEQSSKILPLDPKIIELFAEFASKPPQP